MHVSWRRGGGMQGGIEGGYDVCLRGRWWLLLRLGRLPLGVEGLLRLGRLPLGVEGLPQRSEQAHPVLDPHAALEHWACLNCSTATMCERK